MNLPAGLMGHVPFAHSMCRMDDRQLELKEVCAIPRRFWVLPKTSMLLPCLSIPYHSTRSGSRVISLSSSYRWFSGGSMVTDDEKQPYC